MIAKETIEAIDLPFEEAIRFFAQKTNVTTKTWQDVWEAAHARAFSVAGAATQALVEDFRRAVTKVIAEGMTLGEFRKEFDKIVQTHGWTHTGKAGWRARIIYQTNVNMAHAAGRYAQMSAPDALAIRPYWQYVHSGNPHPRLQHKAWNGLTLLADDPWWSTHYPPNGWNCGCYVLPMTARGLARQGRGGPDQAPPLDLQQKLVKKTGETVVGPAGVDPGFAYNPGEVFFGKAKLPGNAITAVPVAPPAPAIAGSGLKDGEPGKPGAPAPPLKSSGPAGKNDPLAETHSRLSLDYAAWGAGLAAKALGVLRDYKLTGYKEINEHLRGVALSPRIVKSAEVLDETLAGAPATRRPLTVFRGVTADNPVLAAEIGAIVEEPGFMSSTLSPDIADVFKDGDPPGRVVEIRVPKGYHGMAYIENYPKTGHLEFEVLFRAGTRMKVIENSKDRLIVEVIDEPGRKARIAPGAAR